jgi:hypothetical protein
MALHAAWNALAVISSAALSTDGAATGSAGAVAVAGFVLLSLGAASVLARITKTEPVEL